MREIFTHGVVSLILEGQIHGRFPVFHVGTGIAIEGFRNPFDSRAD
jgi:hypothetical protein